MIIRKNTDKHRISYLCKTQPEMSSGLNGFVPMQQYIGRAYNGLVEVSPEWGNGGPTTLMDFKQFKQYFEIVQPGRN